MCKTRQVLLYDSIRASAIFLGVIAAVNARAGQVDDFSQMDNPSQHKQQAQDDLSKALSRQVLSRLTPEAAQKYQTSIARFKGKNGEEILQILQADNDTFRAAMTPKERNRMDEIRKNFDAVAKRSMAGPQPASLAEVLEKKRLQGIESGTIKPMSAQEKAYWDHLKVQVHQRMSNAGQLEKSQRMLEESRTYLQASLARQAMYAKNFKDTSNIANETKGPPLPLDAMQSNWLVRSMANKATASNIPTFTELPTATAAAVKAQMEDVLKQIRDHKSMTPAERYGIGAQFRPDVTANTNTSYQDWMRANGKQVNDQDSTTAARPSNGVPVVPLKNGVTEKGKTATDMPVQKPTAIPGL